MSNFEVEATVKAFADVRPRDTMHDDSLCREAARTLAEALPREIEAFDASFQRTDPLSNYAISRLHDFARALAQMDFHQRSETHITFCLVIGRQGVRGFGCTADLSFRTYIHAVDETLRGADRNELAYWLKRCEAIFAQSKLVGRRAEPTPRCSALSGQVGIRLSAARLATIESEAKSLGKSRNSYVHDLLDLELSRLDRLAETNDLPGLILEVDRAVAEDDSLCIGDVQLYAWSQRVSEDLQARLLLLAKEFKVSSAKLSRYLLVRACIGHVATAC